MTYLSDDAGMSQARKARESVGRIADSAPALCWRCLCAAHGTYTSRSAYFGLTELSICCGAKVI